MVYFVDCAYAQASRVIRRLRGYFKYTHLGDAAICRGCQDGIGNPVRCNKMVDESNSARSCKQLLALAVSAEQEDPAMAEEYFDLAIAAAQVSSSDLELACSRFGAFLRRQGRDNEARLLFPAAPGEMPKVDRFEALRVNRAKDVILKLKRAGAFVDEADAIEKLSNYMWLRANDLDSVATLLLSRIGTRACRMVFGETVSVARVSLDFESEKAS